MVCSMKGGVPLPHTRALDSRQRAVKNTDQNKTHGFQATKYLCQRQHAGAQNPREWHLKKTKQNCVVKNKKSRHLDSPKSGPTNRRYVQVVLTWLQWRLEELLLRWGVEPRLKIKNPDDVGVWNNVEVALFFHVTLTFDVTNLEDAQELTIQNMKFLEISWNCENHWSKSVRKSANLMRNPDFAKIALKIVWKIDEHMMNCWY